jgi:hypothetical protein
MFWPATAIAQSESNIDIEVVAPGSISGIGGLARDGNLYKASFPPDADIVILQRPSNRYLAQAVPMMREAGVTVIVDMDDDLSLIHPANPAFRLMHPKNDPMSNWQNARDACRDASLVIVSTDALLDRYASHGRGVVLRNCVPEIYLKIDHEDSDMLGWAGALHSHPDDPKVLGPALARVGRTLEVFGPEDPLLPRAFGCAVNTSGSLPLQEWPYSIAKIGVGIAPLMDTKFNTCKSWLKPLEYAACGVPWVGSPAAEYTRLHSLGCGEIAAKPKQWVTAIQRLLGSPSLRQEQSEAGRLVAASLTIEGNAWRWLEAWTDAYRREH